MPAGTPQEKLASKELTAFGRPGNRRQTSLAADCPMSLRRSPRTMKKSALVERIRLLWRPNRLGHGSNANLFRPHQKQDNDWISTHTGKVVEPIYVTRHAESRYLFLFDTIES